MTLKELARPMYYHCLLHYLFPASLKSSAKERKEVALINTLEKIIPDLTYQYTTHKLDMTLPYTKHKIRGQHAFQMSLALKAIELLSKRNEKISIVDIGDSAGTHVTYLKELLKNSKFTINTLSVNCDSTAVEKVKKRGLDAIKCRAEELHLHPEFNKSIDLFLSYEMLEHLFDPISFLHQMSEKSDCELFAITVPYVKRSRVGMSYIRTNLKGGIYAEGVHIFELSPEDWTLIFKFTGWEIIYEDKYTQYPRKGLLNLTKYSWRRSDFDGFYGVILRKNSEISRQYQSWP